MVDIRKELNKKFILDQETINQIELLCDKYAEEYHRYMPPYINEDVVFKSKVISIVQYYDDKPEVTFNIGDKLTIGTIVDFMRTNDGKWYVLTDNPSDWHKENGIENGWDWLWAIEKM